ncbi:MAG TPA: gluconokinase, partial [Anaerolineales bacterium]
MKPWFLGIDLGTGSCKTLITGSQAQILGFGASDYAALDTQHKWQEQDPASIMTGLIRSVRSAMQQADVEPEGCQALSIGGALHSLIALDARGQPLTGVITWADGRGTPQAHAIRQAGQASEIYQRTGCPVHSMYSPYKILWILQERPEVFKAAARYVTAKEYVLEKLTGEQVVDYSLASGGGLLNVTQLDWDDLALDISGISRKKLSRLASPLTTFRGLKIEMAQALGIPPHTPLVLGSSDAANSSLGAGAVNPWQATCMVGTSGAFRILASHPHLDAKARTWCYAVDETHWLVGGAINNGGIALSWLRDAINSAFPGDAGQTRLSFDDLARLAGQVEAGAGGLICLPFFTGERSPNWNLNARAVLFGLTLQHDIRHMSRALLEGVAFRLRSLDEILSEMEPDLREIRASGGFTYSDLWLQIISSALDRTLSLPAWGETSSLGAIFWAMYGAGALASIEQGSDFVSLERQYMPLPKDAAVYDRLYPL